MCRIVCTTVCLTSKAATEYEFETYYYGREEIKEAGLKF